MAPLHIAAVYGSVEFCSLLLEHGAQVNRRAAGGVPSYGNTPLIWAVHRGGPAVVKVLMQHGADPKITNRSRASALSLISKPQPWYMGFPSPPEAPQPRQKKLTEAERTEMAALLGVELEANK